MHSPPRAADPLPGPDLVCAFVAGHPGSRDALLDGCLPVVLQWCARLGGPRVDAEDAAQDVLVVVLTRVERLDDPSRFRSWLFGVTRRVLSDHRRRAWIRRWVPGASPERAEEGPGPERLALASETGRAVQGLLERLPRKQREVLVLCDLEERTAAEAAELLAVPVGTIKSRLRLGRERLRGLAEAARLQPLRPCEEAP